jgi:acyl carrier protein
MQIEEKMSIKEGKIKQILSGVTEIKQECIEGLKPGDDLRDIGLNSLTSVELIVKLEEEFNITVEDDDLLLESVSTIEKIISLLDKYIS